MGCARDSRAANTGARWRGSGGWFLVVVVLAVGSLAGYWWGRTHMAAGFENAYLEVEAEYLDFGEVWEQKGFHWTLPIHNHSSQEVLVSRLIASCACMDVTPKSLLIPAGKRADAHLTLDLSVGHPRQASSQSRPFSVRIVPVIEKGLPQYQGWELQGRVRRPFRLSPPVLAFGDTLIAGEPFAAQTVEVTANVELDELAAEPEEPAPVAATVERAEDAGCYRVRVAAEQTTPVGRYQFNILLKGVTESGERLPPVPLPVVMLVLDDIQAVPASVTFGALPLQESAEETVVLRSRTGKSFEVVSTQVDRERGLSVERLTTTDREVSFRVRQRAVAFRSQAHYVRFTLHDESGEATQEVRVPVSYYGVEQR